MTSSRNETFARLAALGLFAVAQTACDGGVAAADVGGGGSGSTSGSGTGGAASGGAASGGAASGGAGGAAGPVEGVTSSKVIPDLSLEEFTEMCDEVGGSIEIHPTCGGRVTGKGFSYDSDTDVFTEHTCAGYNTCPGFSCVLGE